MKGIPEVTIEMQRISRTIEQEGLLIGSIDILYPQIVCQNSVTEQYINGVYQTIAVHFQREILHKAFPKQKKQKKQKNVQDTGNLLIAQSRYHCTFHKNGILSGYSDDISSRLHSGVEHTIRISTTFNLATGKYVWLSSLFKRFTGHQEKIVSYIKDAIAHAADPSIYHENAAELADSKFYPENFYLTEKEIVFYYQPGELTKEKGLVCVFAIPKSRFWDSLR